MLVTATVQRQIAGLFVAEDRGAHELKGVPAAVTLYRIVRASGGGRRGGARALTPLVGREEELDLLAGAGSARVAGDGQLALIVGEPGIGKSRLVEEFRAKLAETPHTWLDGPAPSSCKTRLSTRSPNGQTALRRRGRDRRTASRRSRDHFEADRPGRGRDEQYA